MPKQIDTHAGAALSGTATMATRRAGGRCLPVLLTLLLLASGSCARERAKREAKRRVFAPPATDPIELRAREKLDAQALAKDAQLARRVMTMPFAEIAARLGDLQFRGQQTLSFAREGKKSEQSQKVKIAQAAGGAFAVDVDMRGGDKQHLVYVDDVFYLRHNYGSWRTSRDPTDERLRWREQAYRLWPAIYELFAPSLSLSQGRAQDLGGRAAVVYALSVSPGEAPPPMPAEAFAPPEDGGMLRNYRREAERAELWRSHLAPQSGGGQLWIDEQTGVPLKVEFSGNAQILDRADARARLRVELTCELSDIGKKPAIAPPKDYVEEFTRRKIVTRPLAFIDGGLPAAPRVDGGP